MSKEEKENAFIMRRRQVQAVTGLSRSGLYLQVANRTFPGQFPLGKGARAVGWLSTEVYDWVAKQHAQSHPTSLSSACKPAGSDAGAQDRKMAPKKGAAQSSEPSRGPLPPITPETTVRP
jgi:prophage regulatory protein